MDRGLPGLRLALAVAVVAGWACEESRPTTGELGGLCHIDLYREQPVPTEADREAGREARSRQTGPPPAGCEHPDPDHDDGPEKRRARVPGND